MEWTPLIIFLTVAYFFVNSIYTYDLRVMQWKRAGDLPPDFPSLPSWIAIFLWLNWIIFGVLLYLNWKYALVIFALRFVLKVLPVLETIGGILTYPIRKK